MPGKIFTTSLTNFRFEIRCHKANHWSSTLVWVSGLKLNTHNIRVMIPSSGCPQTLAIPVRVLATRLRSREVATLFAYFSYYRRYRDKTVVVLVDASQKVLGWAGASCIACMNMYVILLFYIVIAQTLSSTPAPCWFPFMNESFLKLEEVRDWNASTGVFCCRSAERQSRGPRVARWLPNAGGVQGWRLESCHYYYH